MAETQDHDASIVSIAGVNTSDLYFLAVLSLPTHPTEVTSVIYTLSYAGNASSQVVYTVDTWLTRMDRSSGGVFYAVSIDGELHYSRNGFWHVLDVGVARGLNSVWAASDNDAFAVGRSGERARITNGVVQRIDDSAARNLYTVTGSDRNNVIAVGDSGVIHWFDGQRWSELESPTNYNLLTALVRSESEIYIGGARGVLFRGDGTRWEKLKAPPDLNITSLAWYGDRLYACTRPVGGIHVLTPSGLELIKSLDVTNLKAIGDHLFAIGGRLVAFYDGAVWRGGNLEL